MRWHTWNESEQQFNLCAIGRYVTTPGGANPLCDSWTGTGTSIACDSGANRFKSIIVGAGQPDGAETMVVSFDDDFIAGLVRVVRGMLCQRIE